MKILVFDIWSQYGHFRVPYTTSSPLSFPIPTKTAVYGMLGALIGLDKKDYLNHFQDSKCKITIGIKKPIIKKRISELHVKVKDSLEEFFAIDSRSRIKIEFLKFPKYRLFVSHDDNKIYSQIKENLESHKSVYSLCMGLSECLANYEFLGEYEPEVMNSKEFQEISSIIPFEELENQNSIKLLEPGKKFLRTHIPLEMKPNREILKTGDFLIEANGYKIKAKIKNKILFIPELKENIIMF